MDNKQDDNDKQQHNLTQPAFFKANKAMNDKQDDNDKQQHNLSQTAFFKATTGKGLLITQNMTQENTKELSSDNTKQSSSDRQSLNQALPVTDNDYFADTSNPVSNMEITKQNETRKRKAITPGIKFNESFKKTLITGLSDEVNANQHQCSTSSMEIDTNPIPVNTKPKVNIDFIPMGDHGTIEEQVAQYREKDRIRKQMQRANKTDEEKKEALEKDALRKNPIYGKMDENKKVEYREYNKLKQEQRRSTLTDVEKEEIKRKETLRKKKANEEMDEDGKTKSRELNRLSHEQRRSNLTDEEKEEANKKEAQAKKSKRGQVKLGKSYRKARDPNANPDFYQLSDFNVKCKHCDALHFQEERLANSEYSKDSLVDSFGDCCNHGKLAAEMKKTIVAYPDELKVLFTPNQNELNHKNFIMNIRQYNSAFSCASLSCTRIDFDKPSGPPCFKIQGQVYHKFNQNAQPLSGEDVPTNGQIYFLDTKEALEAIAKEDVTKDCDNEVLKQINSYLHENYIYAKSYKMMKDVYTEEKEKAEKAGDPIPDIRMTFGTRNNLDKNRYNIPKSNEVCAVFVCEPNGDVPLSNMVVYPIGDKKLTNIYPLDENILPMTYPLLYPNNCKGWNFNMKDDNGKRISLCDFTKFHLFFRDNEKFIPHFYASKLFQQYVVDQAARIEWNNLNYLRTHQTALGRESYKSLEETIKKRVNDPDVKIDPHVILPSSFSQGPRNMHESFMDAMSIVQETGKPDVFLTFTCNPNDPDIKKALEKGQTASDRPDIVARVFRLKRDKLLEEIMVDHIFGKTTGHVWVIEYQKRGLPHMHLLFSLRTEDKMHTTDDVDEMISCELPDQATEPALYKIVTENMIHGPCGEEFPDRFCWNEDKQKCDKKYPRPFKDQTEMNDDGYPFYKRPNNGRFFEKREKGKKVYLTNQNVVPHNVYLLKRFMAHINVEKVADVKAIKYIYKYVYKGYDQAILDCIKLGHLKYDEIKNYLDARFLSPCEACWRIFKFSFQGKSHHVEKLAVHLDGKHNVFYSLDASDEQIKKAMQKDTTLTAYFKFHDQHPEMRNEDGSMILYTQMPKKCTWLAKEKKWKPREAKFNSIARMYPVNPSETELFYLRYLLLHVPAKSFEDLRTYNDIVYHTFAKAALARGLAQNDDEWKCCLEEASAHKMPNKLRTLFVNILLYCNPKNPELLWDQFKEVLSDDIRKKFQQATQQYIEQRTLELLDRLLKSQEKTLQDFTSLPQLDKTILSLDEDDMIDPKIEQNKAKQLQEKMNNGQMLIYNEVLSSIETNEQCLMFIDGPGGTGKSFTLTAIYHMARANNKIVCNTAFSGIAATVLKKGRTLHNRFGLPLDVGQYSKSRIKNNGYEAEELKKTNVFIWDEAPMASKYILELIDGKLQEIMKNKLPFGGKTMILSGDFRQCLPIKEFSIRSEIVRLLIRNSTIWQKFNVKCLTENMRADKEAKKFAKDLLEIGNGTAGKNGYIKVPDECYTNGDLIKEIFDDTLETGNYLAMSERAILSPFNAIVDQYNEQIMDKFQGEYETFLSIDTTEKATAFQATPEVLNMVKSTSLPDHELKLKKNCIVRLLRNLNVKEGLCNGTRLRVVGMSKNILQCEIITGDRKGEIEFIPEITLIQTEHLAFPLHRHQFPVKPAFAFTINKSQSQTFTKIGIDYRQEPFTHGHTYVAISRAKSWKGVKIKLAESNKEKLVKNIVYPEVLSNN